MDVFREQTNTEKELYTSLVAANGIKKTIVTIQPRLYFSEKFEFPFER